MPGPANRLDNSLFSVSFGKASRICVVTPYWNESRQLLERCVQSVASQSLSVDHVLVGDGGAMCHDWLAERVARQIALETHHNDLGATPRAFGLEWGVSQGYDAIALLDADNWYEPRHLEMCLAASKLAPCDYVTTERHLVDENGLALPLRDEDIRNHVDTNVLFFLPGSYDALRVWGKIPAPLYRGGDRFFYAALRSHGCQRLHLAHKTVNYHTRLAGQYRLLGREPPKTGNAAPDWDSVERWIAQLSEAERGDIARETGVYLRDLSTLMPLLGAGSEEKIWLVV
jgi:glycosyltransferase involved in cell wall biosynthesis